MGRIKGHYEWDDDDLTPGQKREGGLHQNLYDSDGNLKGSARFVPSEDEADELAVTETTFVPVEGRRLDDEEEDLSGSIAELLASFVVPGVVVAAPRVRRWWQETAVPAIEGRRIRWRERRVQRKTKAPSVEDGTTVEAGRDLAEVPPQRRPRMSSAEAKARLLAALAARAYSEEQLRLVSDAEIVEGMQLAELKQSLAELPAEQVHGVIEAMVKDPAMMSEDTLAELAVVISREQAMRWSLPLGPRSGHPLGWRSRMLSSPAGIVARGRRRGNWACTATGPTCSNTEWNNTFLGTPLTGVKYTVLLDSARLAATPAQLHMPGMPREDVGTGLLESSYQNTLTPAAGGDS